MDVDFPSRNVKNRKPNEEQNTSRLCSLPNNILHLVLSSLPTKDAVKTSILSKRWRNLWKSIHNLDFKEWDSHVLNLDVDDDVLRAHFMSFVYGVILLCNASNIRKFSLSCDVLVDAFDINSWVSAAVRRNVEELNLRLDDFEEPFMLPHSLFSCESLRVLKVEMEHDLKLPSAIRLSNLKTLNLKYVEFLDGHKTQQLFSNCPLLENLYLIDCNWEHVKAVCISGPRLKKVFISDLIGKRVDDQDGSAVDQNKSNGDQNDLNCCQVMILGKSLQHFDYEGDLINDFCLYNSSPLVSASLKARRRCREAAFRGHMLLRELSNANILTIRPVTFEKNFFAHMPLFPNLKRLEIMSQTEPQLPDFASGALLNILQNSPNLNDLEFTLGIRLSTYSEKDDWILNPVPSCFLTHLECIHIWLFRGTEEELHVIKVLLKTATVLKRMFVYSSGVKIEKKIHDQILSFPRGSISCYLLAV